MFGLHMPELIIILVVALLIFGPKKLPEMGKAIGSSIKEFRKGMNEITQPKEETNEDHIQKLTTTDPIIHENISRLNSADLPKAYVEHESANSMEEVKRD